MRATECWIVLTTVNDRDRAEKLARILLKEKAAACVTLSAPAQSLYWWQEKIVCDSEWVLMIKTTPAAYPETERLIRENHPYSVPEILAVPVQAGQEDYLRWVRESTRPRQGEEK